MGCVVCKSESRRSTFESDFNERAQKNLAQGDKKFDVNKNPIMLRRAKSHSQTPVKEIRTNPFSEIPTIQNHKK